MTVWKTLFLNNKKLKMEVFGSFAELIFYIDQVIEKCLIFLNSI